MVKLPARWTQPASDKASAAAEQKQLKPGKSDLATPRDMDWHKAAKESGVGFACNPISVPVRGDNPAAGSYRNPPEHKYQIPGTGADGGLSRVWLQNTLAGKRK
jgi:hypothetical protein